MSITQRIEAKAVTVGDVKLALAVLNIAGKKVGVTERMTVRTLWSKVGQHINEALEVR